LALQDADVEAVRAKYARDLNCLLDEDRNKRRRALELFAKAFASLPVAYLMADVLPPVLRTVADPVEKNRELAVLFLVDSMCVRCSDGLPLLARRCIPVIAARVGTLPFAEPAEEIRKKLVELLAVFLKSPVCADVVREEFSAVVEVLVKAASDAFPDVKVPRLRVHTTASMLCTDTAP
jgi:hypothetical protein